MQAETTAQQVPSIVYNAVNSRVALLKMQNAKLDALSLALERTRENSSRQIRPMIMFLSGRAIRSTLFW